MKIKEIKSRNRRDFTAIYKCGHCGFEHSGTGYDDDNFHQNVIPNMTCLKCGKREDDDYIALPTKYPAWMQV